LLDLHPLYRSAVWNNWKTVRGAISAWQRIGAMVSQERPALVVGTGGYAAGVMMAYAAAHDIPMVQQAGDSVPGLTARWFSKRSIEIYLAFPEAARALSEHHPGSLVDTGAPIEPPPSPRPDRAAARRAWGFPERGGHVVLVYGGSQGSLAINQAVAEWLAEGPGPDLFVIWATGRATADRFKQLESDRVRVREYLSPISDAYAATDLAIGRAGATSTAELFAWGIPAVLVPLPTAAADHQTTNAMALEQAGAAIHLRQSALTAQTLGATVRRVLDLPGELERMASAASARARPTAAADIAERIERIVGARPS
jgi:UDP-N-acetylglucosamine--N-acetylmuramyl-(pentapeptide) pyrophosphoryl-undecaprenol N-acetylglucosamine transferase